MHSASPRPVNTGARRILAFAFLWRRMVAVGGNPSTLAAGGGIFLLSSRRYEGESGLTIQRGVSSVAQTSH
jgi:hypothetical protein